MCLQESAVEQAALSWLGELDYRLVHASHFAPGEITAERGSFGDVVLSGRLRDAIAQLNPADSEDAREEAIAQGAAARHAVADRQQPAFHPMLRDGVPVEYRRDDGSIAGDHVRLIDFDDPEANDWLAVNQFTVIEGQHNRRPDIVVFVNGLPLGVIELKNAADEDATIGAALQPTSNLQAGDSFVVALQRSARRLRRPEARIGSLTANQEWFKVWRTIEGEGDAPKTALELDVLVRGVFEKRRFLDLLQHFIVFEEDTDSGRCTRLSPAITSSTRSMRRWKKRCGRAACRRPGKRTGPIGRARCRAARGDRRAGVVWHTQGSGKSFSMLFYAGRIVRHPAMQNPTLVVLTDRNDLDDQLFGQFQRCHELLRQMPVQAESVEHLRELLKVASGGVVFTTIQKFMPEKGGRCRTLSQAAEHRRHRRRSAPQPIRPDRRARPQSARRAAECVVHRLHGHAHREERRQHAGHLRRLHQHLRHPAGGGGQGDGADLLREPDRQAGLEPGRAAEDRRGVRGDHRGRGSGHARRSSRPNGPRWRRWSAIRSGSRSSPPIWCSTTSGGWKRWTARR